MSTPPGVTFTQVSLAGLHSLAVGSDGNTYAWGNNSGGGLGDGTTTDRSTPVLVSTPPGVTFTRVSSGYFFSLAVGSDGNTYAWGQNSLGQLGDGTTTNRLVPGEFGLTAVTGVTFDGIPGTDLVNNGDGTWSVKTPPHVSGPVDVVVSWTRAGVVQPPFTYAAGFTYYSTPTVSDPKDQTVVVGGVAKFTVTTSGLPKPVVSWEYSPDGGATWSAIPSEIDASVSADGLTLSVTGVLDYTGYLFRAAAENVEGVTMSAPAALTVTEKVPPTPVPPTTAPPTVAPSDASLARTGADAAGVTILGLAALLLLISGTLVFAVTRGKRASSEAGAE